ncbi:hypothetical protein C8R45DRAFT_944817 [Mycena sanguinolenta]|nr:hypothetical protein C8R45DRAFT_944817 [Mycena sanguinolenta]
MLNYFHKRQWKWDESRGENRRFGLTERRKSIDDRRGVEKMKGIAKLRREALRAEAYPLEESSEVNAKWQKGSGRDQINQMWLIDVSMGGFKELERSLEYGKCARWFLHLGTVLIPFEHVYNHCDPSAPTESADSGPSSAIVIHLDDSDSGLQYNGCSLNHYRTKVVRRTLRVCFEYSLALNIEGFLTARVHQSIHPPPSGRSKHLPRADRVRGSPLHLRGPHFLLFDTAAASLLPFNSTLFHTTN